MISYVVGILVALFTLGVNIALYRLYFHPLARFPGPRLWAMSRLPMAYNLVLGKLPYRIAEIHNQYGPVVRLAPGEVSFITPDAWDPIYGKKSGKPELAKDPYCFLKPTTGIYGLFFEHDENEHSRMKRNFSFAFSEKCMRAQEPIIQKYINLLILRLGENTHKAIDFAEWYTYITFDSIGDLMFGESFHCLQDSRVHPWMKMLFDWVAGAAFLGMSQRFWPLYPILMALVPKHLKDADRDHTIMTRELVLKRLKNTEHRPDFLAYVQDYINVPGGMTIGELIETCRAIIVGGAETMATVLSASTYFLIKNPAVMQRLKDEIRNTFDDIDQITMQNVAKLEYQYAVIQEVLRLFPPVPGILNRLTPREGCVISGHHVPGNVAVSVNMYAAFRSRDNFERPEEFLPERWLPESNLADKKKVFQPFAIGPRVCIGKNLALMEMRLILARIIFAFDMALEPQSESWIDNMPVYGFFAKPKMMVKLTPHA